LVLGKVTVALQQIRTSQRQVNKLVFTRINALIVSTIKISFPVVIAAFFIVSQVYFYSATYDAMKY